MAWCVIWWFCKHKKEYGHTWHWMSLLRIGVTMQPKNSCFINFHSKFPLLNSYMPGATCECSILRSLTWTTHVTWLKNKDICLRVQTSMATRYQTYSDLAKCAPAIHYSWVARVSMECKVCLTLLHLIRTRHRTANLFILSLLQHAPTG